MRRRALQSFEEAEEEPLINLTPLIDVVFVVLISFMILAPILDVESVDLAPSGPLSQKEGPSSEQLSFSLKGDGSIWLKGKKVTLEELEPLLKAEKKRNPRQTPQVAPDKNAPFGTYQEVKNLLERIGFQQMDVLLKPQ